MGWLFIALFLVVFVAIPMAFLVYLAIKEDMPGMW